MSEIEVVLPVLHEGQALVRQEAARFNVLACGRRWGKTVFGVVLACIALLKGQKVGWFAPTSDYYHFAWELTKRYLHALVAEKSETSKRLVLLNGGEIKFWSIHEKADAGRGDKYHLLVCDEAAMVSKLGPWWHEAGRATLADYQGTAWFLSTPKGLNAFHDLWGNEAGGKKGWKSWQMPTDTNPHIARAELEELKELPERAYSQEILAEFLEDGSGVFRGVKAVVSARKADEPAQEEGFYQVGLDVARHEDYTVCTVLDSQNRQVYFSRVNQVSWKRVVEVVKSVSATYRARVVMDSTGVGDAVYEMLVQEGVPVFPYHFTHASKAGLIENLAIMVENQRIELLDVPEQTAELLAFQYERTPGGRYTMNAPEGHHDDCVIALALAAYGMDRAAPRHGTRSGGKAEPKLAPHPEDAERHESNRRRIEALRGKEEERLTRVR